MDGRHSPVVDPHGNVYAASADGYDLGAGQPYDDSDAVLELSPTMHLESIFYPKDWQKLSADDLDLGTGNPVLVDGFVFQVGKTDIAYLLRQGHLGGEEGEVASLSTCRGNPDGGRAVEGSVVYVPCPNGVTAIKVSTKPPYLKQLWTDNDGAAGAPIIADGLVWTIGRQRGPWPEPGQRPRGHLDPLRRVPNHFPTPAVGDGLLLLPGIDQSSPSWVPPGCRRRPPLGEGRLLAVRFEPGRRSLIVQAVRTCNPGWPSLLNQTTAGSKTSSLGPTPRQCQLVESVERSRRSTVVQTAISDADPGLVSDDHQDLHADILKAHPVGQCPEEMTDRRTSAIFANGEWFRR